MGTGTMIVLDDQTCPVGMVWNLTQFFARSPAAGARLAGAGWDGRERIAGSLGRRPREARRFGAARAAREIMVARKHFCALAPGAAEPLQSALKYFRDDFERHIREDRCPCEMTMATVYIDNQAV